MFSQLSDKMANDPQVRVWMNNLAMALLVLVLLMLATDFFLLARWLLYRQRLRTFLEDSVVPVVAEDGAIDISVAKIEPPSPFAPQWSLVHVFVGGQVVVFLANLLAAIPILIAVFASWAHRGSHVGDTALVDKVTLYTILASLFVQNILFVGVVAYFLKGYGLSLRRIGLRRPTYRQIGLGIGLGVALLVVSGAAEAVLGSALAHAIGPATTAKLAKMSEALGAAGVFNGMPGWLPKLIFVLGGAVAAPIGEEVFFRGFLYNALKHRFSVKVGIVVSGLLFALVHISPLALLIIFPMGMLLAYVYEKTGSLWVTITMHIINNGVVFVAMWLGLNT